MDGQFAARRQSGSGANCRIESLVSRFVAANTPAISARAKLGMFKYRLFATAKPKNATLAPPGPGYFRLLELC
jgi:hypothetical protein